MRRDSDAVVSNVVAFGRVIDAFEVRMRCALRLMWIYFTDHSEKRWIEKATATGPALEKRFWKFWKILQIFGKFLWILKMPKIGLAPRTLSSNMWIGLENNSYFTLKRLRFWAVYRFYKRTSEKVTNLSTTKRRTKDHLSLRKRFEFRLCFASSKGQGTLVILSHALAKPFLLSDCKCLCFSCFISELTAWTYC